MTFLTPSQQVLLFLLPFAVTLIIGAGNYVLVRLGYDKVPDFVEGLSFPCALLLFLFMMPLLWLFPPILLLFPLSFLAARADRAISTEQDTFGWHYWRLCVSLVASLVNALLLYVFLDWFEGTKQMASGVMDSRLALTGCIAGFLVGPIMAPLWIWGYRSTNAFFENRSIQSQQFE